MKEFKNFLSSTSKFEKMFDQNSKFGLILAAAFLLFNFAAINAQELGGNLGGSSGVFRFPKSATSAARETKKPARKIALPAKPKTSSKTTAKTNRASAKSVKIEKSKTAAKNTVRALGRNSETGGTIPPVNVDELFETATDEGNAVCTSLNMKKLKTRSRLPCRTLMKTSANNLPELSD